MATVANTVKLYSEKGIEGIISLNRNVNSDQARRKLDGRAEARIIEIACSPAPEGHSRWTFRLLEEQANFVAWGADDVKGDFAKKQDWGIDRTKEMAYYWQ